MLMHLVIHLKLQNYFLKWDSKLSLWEESQIIKKINFKIIRICILTGILYLKVYLLLTKVTKPYILISFHKHISHLVTLKWVMRIFNKYRFLLQLNKIFKINLNLRELIVLKIILKDIKLKTLQ